MLDKSKIAKKPKMFLNQQVSRQVRSHFVVCVAISWALQFEDNFSTKLFDTVNCFLP